MPYNSPADQLAPAPAPRDKPQESTLGAGMAASASPISVEPGTEMSDEMADAIFKSGVGALGGYAVSQSGRAVLKNPMGGGMRAQLGNMSAAEKVALKKIARALENDEMSIADARQRIRDASPKTFSLIDAAGRNTLNLGRDVVQAPGKALDMAHDMFRQRQEGNADPAAGVVQPAQGDRIMEDVNNLISPNTDFYGSARSMAEQRRAQAKVDYDRAMETGGDFSKTVRNLIQNTATGPKAWKQAVDIAKDEGVDLSGLMAALQKNRFANREDTMKLLHYFKQGVDQHMETQMAEDMFGDPKHTTASGKIRDNIQKPLVRELRRMNPDYAAAMDKFSDMSRHMDALAQGRKFMSEDAEVTARELARMSSGEREMFRAGVVRGIRDKVKSTPDGADVVKRIFNTPAKRDALKVVLPDEALYNEFTKRMGDESTMVNSARAVLGGPNTAEKLISAQHNGLDDTFLKKLFHPDAGNAAWAAVNLGHGNIPGAAAHIMSSVARRSKGLPENVREAVGKRLFDPATATRTLRDIEQAGKNAVRRNLILRRAGIIGAGLGAGIGAGLSALESGGDDDN